MTPLGSDQPRIAHLVSVCFALFFGTLLLFSRALNKMGVPCNLMCVQSTEHAVKLLDNYSPDFIFIDCDMTQEDGLSCLREIKKSKNAKDIPVIVYSDKINGERSEAAVSMGAFTWLKRPQMIGTLVRKLRDIMVR